MRIFTLALILISVISLTSCASGYKTIEPRTINYVSKNVDSDVTLEYKYQVLRKKYAKKEVKKGIKVVAVKITNQSANDVMFGNDIYLAYENGNQVMVLENDKVFKSLKQSPASYLLYLLLTPLNFYTTTTSDSRGYQDNTTTSSFPIGLILGPGIAGGNLLAASSANSKFKSELLVYNINGLVIKSGETKYGLIGIKSDSFDALKIQRKK